MTLFSLKLLAADVQSVARESIFAPAGKADSSALDTLHAGWKQLHILPPAPAEAPAILSPHVNAARSSLSPKPMLMLVSPRPPFLCVPHQGGCWLMTSRGHHWAAWTNGGMLEAAVLRVMHRKSP